MVAWSGVRVFANIRENRTVDKAGLGAAVSLTCRPGSIITGPGLRSVAGNGLQTG